MIGTNVNSGGYNAFEALNAAKKDRKIRDAESSGEVIVTDYKTVLVYVQTNISNSQDYNRTLQDNLDDPTASTEQLKSIVFTLLQRYRPSLDGDVIDKYLIRILDDMIGYGMLTPYLNDPEVEEINVYGPGPKQIEVIGSRGAVMLDEGFPDSQSVQDIAKRMVRKGNMVVDQSNPRVDSYIGGGTRVSVMIPPIVREDKGAVISIRKQTKSHISKKSLIDSKTAMEEELALVELCTRNKVSGAIVGATGSGKTTLLNYIMTDYVTGSNEQTRVYIIEESRELQLPDDARVFYTAVCGDEKSGTFISAPDLLKSALRFHPTFISCAEMRGEEAMNAMTAAQTGHIVWSTFHAEGGEDAYQRLLTMCEMSGTSLSERLLMKELVHAFPIIVSSQQLKDGSRKITGIYEATGIDERNNVIGHYIYKMQVEKFEYGSNGKVLHVSGYHRRTGDLSDRLAQKIFDNCGRYEDVAPFARPGWKPEGFGTVDSLGTEHVIGF